MLLVVYEFWHELLLYYKKVGETGPFGEKHAAMGGFMSGFGNAPQFAP